MEQKERIRVTEDQIREAENFWDDDQHIMILMYLLHLYEDDPYKGC